MKNEIVSGRDRVPLCWIHYGLRFPWAIRLHSCEIFFKVQNLRFVIDWPQIFQIDANFINQSSSVRSRLSNDRHGAKLRGSLTISKCVLLLLLLLFKMNATRDRYRKGSSCCGVLGQLSHEVLVQHCFSSGLRLNDHTSNLFLTIVIT